MSKHTPGPWRVADVSFASGWDVVAPDSSDGAGPGETQTIADNLRLEDARLIVAAPDMLAALNMVKAAMMRATTIKGAMTVKDIIEECGDAITAAISKAEGRQ